MSWSRRSKRVRGLADDMLSRLQDMIHNPDDRRKAGLYQLVATRDDLLCLLDELGGFERLTDAYRPDDED